METYQSCVDWLFSRLSFEKQQPRSYSERTFKLDRMQAILAALGDPHLSLPAVHIAGTKGKGSTSEMAARILGRHGLRVGLFTSPHLLRFEERIRVDGEEPDNAAVVELVNAAAAAAREAAQSGLGQATFFELITAMAWLHYRAHQVDAVVLEVGLGGRLDTTNLCRSKVTVITSISLDHTELLGNTEAEIAAEKAGILKQGVPLVCGVRHPEARTVIRQRAAELQVSADWVDEQLRIRTESGSEAGQPGQLATFSGPDWTLADVRLPLLGSHQALNAMLAVQACRRFLAESPILETSVRDALEQLRLPVRIEVLGHSPVVIVDAAHNPASIGSLVQTVRESFPGRRCGALVAVSRDKDAPEIIRQLVEPFELLVITEFSERSRSLPAAQLEAIAREAVAHRGSAARIERHDTPEQGWARLIGEPGLDVLCVTGSFFLAAEMRGRCQDFVRRVDVPAELLP